MYWGLMDFSSIGGSLKTYWGLIGFFSIGGLMEFKSN